MKKKVAKRLLLAAVMVFMLALLTSCGKAAPNTVFAVDDLDGKKMGVQLGTTGDIYASDYEGDEAGSVIERYNKGADAIQALKQAKLDCVIIDEQPAKKFVEKNKDLMILEEEFANEDYAITIAKGNTELKSKINKALSELKSDGTLTKIIGNYIGDGAGNSPYTSPEGTSRNNGTLIMATNAAFPPYEFYDNNKIVGIDADMAQAVADKLGMTLVIENMEFDSIINAVQSGKASIGVAGMTVTEDRAKSIDFTDPYTNSKQVIVVRDNDAETGVAANLKERFYDNFIKDARWKYLGQGLLNTVIIALCAALFGILGGFLIAIVRVAHDKNNSLKILNFFCRVYLTVIRGTPIMVQLLIIYYVIFSSVNINKVLVAIIAFGINSAAYVAEIIRSGIMSIDNGQFEAGRSLGLTFNHTMISIVIPQAFKNVLPALANEFIALLKETSISGYIGLLDLTRGGDIIRSITYEAFIPLIAVALIYLVLVMALTFGVNKLERRLKKNER